MFAATCRDQRSRLQHQIFDLALPRPISNVRNQFRAQQILTHIIAFLTVALAGTKHVMGINAQIKAV